MATPTQEEILKLLTDCFQETMGHRSVPGVEDVLFGPDGLLDSMDLVNFAAEVEEVVNEKYGTDIIVADARALSGTRSPFRSLSALSEFCIEQLRRA